MRGAVEADTVRRLEEAGKEEVRVERAMAALVAVAEADNRRHTEKPRKRECETHAGQSEAVQCWTSTVSHPHKIQLIDTRTSQHTIIDNSNTRNPSEHVRHTASALHSAQHIASHCPSTVTSANRRSTKM